MIPCPCLNIFGIPQKIATAACFLQTENISDKLPFVFCKRKWKTDVCFSCSANNIKRYSTIAVSANVSVYAFHHLLSSSLLSLSPQPHPFLPNDPGLRFSVGELKMGVA
jgi:hypothetical protein